SPAATAGSATFVEVRSSANANRRTYLRFDLAACTPAIPTSATVTGSLLRLFVTAVPAACRTHDIFRVTATWTEAALTWNNQPFGTTINNPVSGQRTSFITVGAAPCQNTTANVYVNGWDVKSDVQAFIAGTSTNYGWMIRDDVEGSATARSATFSSKNNNVLLRAPQLTINYRVTP
ncbi:MAG: DNRLRE domain-containing protein, partial [Acidimicrobiia bacterium]|nr:DNRLRE domain-containing protein [Acidimicrobiia bacterium]